MKILHICTQAPGRMSGGEIGILQFSYALTKIAEQVDYVGPKINEMDIAQMYSSVEYLEDKLTFFQKLWSLLHLQFDKKYVSWKKRRIDFAQYDFIFIEFTKLDYILKDIFRSRYNGKILIRAHNVEQDYLRISYESNRSFVNFVKYILSGKREKYMVWNADTVLAITENDKKRLIDLYGLTKDKIVICPVGVNMPETGKSFDGRVDGKLSCLITGSLWFGPNADAIAWFITEVFPEVKDICDLTIAGFRPNSDIKRLCSKAGVTLIDSPESMKPYFEQSDMVLAPIFDGGGMKVKIAEAMSYGLPIVTTVHGAIGYSLIDGENGFIADTTDDFVEAIKGYYSLHNDERKALLESEWKLYCEKYSLEAIRKLLDRQIIPFINETNCWR
ncbi:glycosyltransferase family 4 protein [[Clostridium] symbiosum]|uniref:glycosyltransferase family 4 protein n=1 Tax=Clostridium symbiosum TaxID=1512 RepID=UPI00232AC36D|nr:glycosyltransferase family 4 protein [[Clostridium] symbiosum]MDB2008590.1 glycosyltransferase family 4 protein [[Clostridium] symbiosum]MDB2025954.1 glycosyltransferase family 4 protein [[Clostridium] symbiosum]